MILYVTIFQINIIPVLIHMCPSLYWLQSRTDVSNVLSVKLIVQPTVCVNVTSTSSSKTSTAQSRRNSVTSTLTIDDLYKRFHNRPPPLNSTRFGMPQHYLNIAATNSLSKFLLSALPAFTTFLSDIQGHYNANIYCGAMTYNSRPTSIPRAWTKGHKRPC
jgi:hypothetical protein